jgi:nickel/cobalt transporter (NicO) family protein
MSFLSFQQLNTSSAALLVGSVLVVGVLHTIVPDHWVPITVIARQRGWTTGQTARAALQAGTGHVTRHLSWLPSCG